MKLINNLSKRSTKIPYKSITELPYNVRDNLPQHAQEIYKEAYNSAWDEYADPEDRRDDASREETAHKVAWAAIKNVYTKDEATGEWVKQ